MIFLMVYYVQYKREVYFEYFNDVIIRFKSISILDIF